MVFLRIIHWNQDVCSPRQGRKGNEKTQKDDFFQFNPDIKRNNKDNEIINKFLSLTLIKMAHLQYHSF